MSWKPRNIMCPQNEVGLELVINSHPQNSYKYCDFRSASFYLLKVDFILKKKNKPKKYGYELLPVIFALCDLIELILRVLFNFPSLVLDRSHNPFIQRGKVNLTINKPINYAARDRFRLLKAYQSG